MANYVTYPCKNMNITQGYKGGTHKSYEDYPWDESGKDSDREWCYCPCNEMKVIRKWGVGDGGVNTLFLQSTTPVLYANGSTDYFSWLILHSEDDDLNKIKEGQIFTRGQQICREGTDLGNGNKSGNHFHFQVGKGQFTGKGWKETGKGDWSILTTGGGIKPIELFYVDPNFTTIKDNKDLEFKTLPSNAVIDETPNQTSNGFVPDRSACYEAVDPELIWKLLIVNIENPYGVAGLMGNLYDESRMNPSLLEGYYHNTDADRRKCKEYTEKFDNGGTKNDFKDRRGYGLAQWTSSDRKGNFYDYFKSVGGSISSPYTQIEFLWKELSGEYNKVLSVLKKAKTVKAASNEVLFNFERPKNQDSNVQKERYEKGEEYYNKYKDITAEIAKNYFKTETVSMTYEDYFTMNLELKWVAIELSPENLEE